ncbi:hypothetical protein FPV67DRAFT_1470850 [Lyophyllum atratum]|nr:hypothetical protein FPV67DRAFT_1470850 [Lyophyllum atratum]
MNGTERPRTPPTIPSDMSINKDLRFICKETNGRYTILDNEGNPHRSLEVTQLRSFLRFDAAVRVGKRPLVPVGFRSFRDAFEREPIVKARFIRWTNGNWEVPPTAAPSYLDLAIPIERDDEKAIAQMKLVIDLEDKVTVLEAQLRAEGRNKQRQQEAITDRRARKRLGLPAAPRARGANNHDNNQYDNHDHHRSQPFHARDVSPVRSARGHRPRPYSPPPRMSSPTPRSRRYPSYDRSRSRTRSRTRSRSLTPTQYQDRDMDVDLDDADRENRQDRDQYMQPPLPLQSGLGTVPGNGGPPTLSADVAASIAEAFAAAGGTQATAAGAPSTSGNGAFPPVGVATAAQYPKINKSRAASPNGKSVSASDADDDHASNNV